MTTQMKIEDFFLLGAKKRLDVLVPQPDGSVLNLGCGKAKIDGAFNLDWPTWEAPFLSQNPDETVAAIHMHHFLEHLDAHDGLTMLTECARVLVPAGVVYITLPHAAAMLAFSALDHRTFWTEETMQHLLYPSENNSYDMKFGRKIDLDIAFMQIIGREHRNLQLFVQLRKADDTEFVSSWRRK